MPTNFYMFFVAAFIPLIIGSIYYGDFLFGKTWKRVNGLTDGDLDDGRLFTILGTTYFLGVVAAFFLSGVVIHQGNVFQMMMPEAMEAGSAAQNQFNELIAQYGDKHRSFGHGALHGAIIAVFAVLPIVGINALFERRGWKYILIHTGYWLITFALMGGLLCKTLEYAPMS